MGEKDRKDVDLDELDDLDEVEERASESKEDADLDEDLELDEEEPKSRAEKTSKKKGDDDDDEEEEDDDDDDEEDNEGKKSLIIPIVLALVVIVVVILLLLKACSGKETKYTVKFDTNVEGLEISDVKVKENGKIEEPKEPTREGYEFVGWYYNGEEFDFNQEITGDMILEAKWKKVSVDTDVTGVTIDKTALALEVGQTSTLNAILEPEGGKYKSLTWTSSNENVVTVDQNGKVTAKGDGTATITVKVTTESGQEYTATVEVTVQKEVVPVTGVSFSRQSIEINTGTTSNLNSYVTISPNNATNKGLTWKSSDSSVVTVNKNGVITGVKDGSATITVTTNDGNYKATIKVTVKTVKVTGVKVTINKTKISVNGKAKATATVQPSNATNKKVTWKSLNPDVASVDQSGNVTGLKEGEATIQATTADGSFTGSVKVTVESTYVVTVTKLENKVTHSILQAEVTITKDGKAFEDWKSVTFDGKTRVAKAHYLGDYTTVFKTADILLSDGQTHRTATVKYSTTNKLVD